MPADQQAWGQSIRRLVGGKRSGRTAIFETAVGGVIYCKPGKNSTSPDMDSVTSVFRVSV
jgi:hypothetical protein